VACKNAVYVQWGERGEREEKEKREGEKEGKRKIKKKRH